MSLKRWIRNYMFGDYLDEGEKILYIAHKHILVLKIDSAKTTFFGIVLPVVLFLIFPKFYLVFIVWGLIGAFGVLYHFVDWYCDAWLLTNLGVTGIEWRSFFDVTATRIEYHMIEGIAYTIKGVLQSVFNYGDITIDKLGAQTSVVLKDAAAPAKLERMVMKYQEQYVYSRSIRDHQALKDMLSGMIAYHVQNEKIVKDKDSKKKK